MALADLAEQAARLAKADLVTEMVGEFPELQGLMGGYYARAEGLPDAVADAIRDHYKPVGQGDDVPTAPVTVAVSLADKLDTLFGFFLMDLLPTGSRDPFALRRASIGVLELLIKNGIRLELIRVLSRAGFIYFTTFVEAGVRENGNFKGLYGDLNQLEQIRAQILKVPDGPVEWTAEFNPRETFCSFVMMRVMANEESASQQILDFFADRLKVQQREAGVRHDLIDAVFALGGEDDLVRLLDRVKALQSFVTTEDGANLLAGYKRAANILKKERPEKKVQSEAGEEDPGAALTDPDMAAAMRAHEALDTPAPPSYTPEPAEAALTKALDLAEPRADAAIAGEDFERAMAALAMLRGPIDDFFTDVTVNDTDPIKRESRLNLLTRIRAAVHKVADFSKIEG